MESIPSGTGKMWSLLAGSLYIQVIFRSGFVLLVKHYIRPVTNVVTYGWVTVIMD